MHYAARATPDGQGWRLLIEGVGTAWIRDLWAASTVTRQMAGPDAESVAVYADLVSPFRWHHRREKSRMTENVAEVQDPEPQNTQSPEAVPIVVTEPVEVTEVPAPEPEVAQVPVQAASNESPSLPANAQAAAARAHLVFGKIAAMATAVQADLERFIPAGYLTAAENEAVQLLKEVL